MPQVCLPFATDAKGQTLYEKMGEGKLVLGPGLEASTQKTRHGAHTGSQTQHLQMYPLLTMPCSHRGR